MMWSFLIKIFIIWRISLFLIVVLGEKFITFTPRFPYSDIFLIPSGLPSWIWSFANFDGVHYLTIAKWGYTAQFTQVFFPLYPLLINTIHRIIPLISHILIGLIVSNLFFFLSLIVFWKLLRLDYKWQDIRWILLFFIFFPTSFFFGGLYTESIFLFFVLASFYAAREKRWLIAGILGGLASGTRLVGIFLLPALLWEWHKEKFKVLFDPSSGRGQRSKFKVRLLRFAFNSLRSPVLYLVPLGLAAYMIYLQINFGDYLLFWHVQPVFGAGRSGAGIILLPQVVWRYLKILFTVSSNNYNFWVAFWELVGFVVCCWLLVVGLIKKVRMSYLIFSFLSIITPTLTGTFSSMPRYILATFPMFIVLGLIKNKSFKILLSVICYLLSIIFIILFTRGYWVS